MRRPRMCGTVFRRHACSGIASLCVAFCFSGSTSHAQSAAPTKAAPQFVFGAAQSPTVLYQGRPFTPQPIAPPRPILQRPVLSAPQASAQGGPNVCDCYYPQGYCPFPSGNCSLPQGNCVAPTPSGQWIGASPQGY